MSLRNISDIARILSKAVNVKTFSPKVLSVTWRSCESELRELLIRTTDLFITEIRPLLLLPLKHFYCLSLVPNRLIKKKSNWGWLY